MHPLRSHTAHTYHIKTLLSPLLPIPYHRPGSLELFVGLGHIRDEVHHLGMVKLLGQGLGHKAVHILDARVDVGLSRTIGVE